MTSGPQEQTHGDYINTRLEEIQKMLGIQDCDAQERFASHSDFNCMRSELIVLRRAGKPSKEEVGGGKAQPC